MLYFRGKGTIKSFDSLIIKANKLPPKMVYFQTYQNETRHPKTFSKVIGK